MKLNPIKANITEIETDRYLILISYKTPVAYVDKADNSTFETAKKWSNTTSRHITDWLKIIWPNMQRREVNSNKVPQEVLDNLLNEVK